MKYKMLLPLVVVLQLFLSPAWARKWTDATGTYSVEADLVSVDNGNIRLRKTNGKVVTVPISRLSKDDQAFLRSLQKKAPPEKVAGKLVGMAGIEKALAQKSTLKFEGTPMRDAIRAISQAHKIPVHLHRIELDAVGIGSNSPVSVKGNAASLAALLQEMLNPLELTWLIRDDVLLITSRDFESSSLETRVYRLLKRIGPDNLIDDITTKIDPNSWDEVGGPGSLEVFPPNLVIISQTQRAHRNIAVRYKQLLRPIVSDTAQTVPLPGVKLPLQELNDTTSMEFLETPLEDAVQFFMEVHKTKISIDDKALDDIGVGKDTPVSISLANLRFSSGLNLLTHGLDLTWVADKDGVTITSPEAAEEKLMTVVYPVGDLAGRDANLIIEVITSTVAPASWDEVGGPGSLAARAGALQVKQTYHVQQQIARLLADMRQARRR